MNICVAVSACKDNSPNIKVLFDNIEKMEKKPCNVVVSCSSTPFHEQREVFDKLFGNDEDENENENYSFDYSIVFSFVKLSVLENFETAYKTIVKNEDEEYSVIFFNVEDVFDSEKMRELEHSITSTESIKVL